MDRRLPIKSVLICAAILIPISCKFHTQDAGVKDAVDTNNAMFGTGRAADSRTAKRNCFKSQIFSEDRPGMQLSEGGDSGESPAGGSPAGGSPAGGSPAGGSTSDGSSAGDNSGRRLIRTRINQMNIQTYVISTSSNTNTGRTAGVEGGITVPAGILQALKISPEFTIKVNNVLQENKNSNVDSYVLTVKYMSHALAIQPDDRDFRPDAFGLLDGKEASFKKFISVCGEEFLSKKDFGGDITLAFGATKSDKTSSSETTANGHIGITGPGGIAAKIDPNYGNKSGMTGLQEISNFVVSENALNRASTVECQVQRTNEQGQPFPINHLPFIPKNRKELDEFIYCLPRWIDAVPVIFTYTDYSNIFPVALDQSVTDKYLASYTASKKTWSDKASAEEKASQDQREKEQRQQDALKPAQPEPQKVALSVPKLKTVSPIPGTKLTGYTLQGRQARLDATRKFIRENMVFATPSQCDIAGCDGYNEVDGACTRCQESVQSVSKSYGGINFCRDNTDCKETITCQPAGDGKTGVCR